MKLYIFGTGSYYQNRKKHIILDDVEGFIDNDDAKHGMKLDQKMVFSPDVLRGKIFDYVLIMSSAYEEIRTQLINQGTAADRLINYYSYLTLIHYSKMECYYPTDDCAAEQNTSTIVLVTHDLSNTGAPMVLLYLEQVLRRKKYHCIVFSLQDGPLREAFLMNGTMVVIDETLTHQNLLFSKCVADAKCVIFNTNQLAYLVDACGIKSDHIVWWLHEGLQMYDSTINSYLDNIVKSNTKIYAVSSIARDAMVSQSTEVTEQDIAILPYGLPDIIQTEVKHNHKIIFAIIGSVSMNKGHDVLGKTLCHMDEDMLDDMEVWVIGKVVDQEIYRQLDLLQLHQVKMVGEVSHQELQSLYAEIDVVLCPSRIDCLPVVAVEGMMNQCVCVVSTGTGICKYIEHHVNGLICQAGDMHTLQLCMEWLISNKKEIRYMKKKSRQIYENEFEFQQFEKRIEELVNND